jgi:hypothetical protein
MIARGDTLDPTLARIVTVFAAVIAVALAVALPTAYFVSSHAVGYAAIVFQPGISAEVPLRQAQDRSVVCPQPGNRCARGRDCPRWCG